MATLTIRNLNDALKASLRQRAAKHDRSMEEEVRQMIRQALAEDRTDTGLGSRISRRFAAAGGVHLPSPKRSRPRRLPAFSS